MAGVNIKCSFSNKPTGNYKDYYEKFTNYINIISFPAIAKDKTVTANTFRNVLTRENSVFEYVDTNSSRAGIDACNDKLSKKRIGIIGLGGTGSYILDLISKTNIEEIHLFDGDYFCQHNAFRSPGAADKSVIQNNVAKTEYFQSEYSKMHKNIFSHPMYITNKNIDELNGLDFIFISIDSGEARKTIAEYLVSKKIPFVDTGMGLQYLNGCINGQIRTSLFDVNNYDKMCNYLDFQEDGEDVYNTNIQIAECNALNAILAVIEFKRYFGIYNNANNSRQTVYSIDMGGMICEE